MNAHKTESSLPAEALAGQSVAAKPPVRSGVIDAALLPAKTSPIGTFRRIFDGPTVTLRNLEGHITTLNPGQTSHAPHQHFNEEMILLNEGTLEVSINGQLHVARAGAVLFFASNDWHGVRNIGESPATYYVFNWHVFDGAVDE